MKTLGFLKGMVIGLMLTTGVVAVSAQDEKRAHPINQGD